MCWQQRELAATCPDLPGGARVWRTLDSNQPGIRGKGHFCLPFPFACPSAVTVFLLPSASPYRQDPYYSWNDLLIVFCQHIILVVPSIFLTKHLFILMLGCTNSEKKKAFQAFCHAWAFVPTKKKKKKKKKKSTHLQPTCRLLRRTTPPPWDFISDMCACPVLE